MRQKVLQVNGRRKGGEFYSTKHHIKISLPDNEESCLFHWLAFFLWWCYFSSFLSELLLIFNLDLLHHNFYKLKNRNLCAFFPVEFCNEAERSDEVSWPCHLQQTTITETAAILIPPRKTDIHIKQNHSKRGGGLV